MAYAYILGPPNGQNIRQTRHNLLTSLSPDTGNKLSFLTAKQLFTIVQRKTPPCIKIRTNLLWIICPSDNRLHMSGRLVPTVLSSYLIDLAHYPLTFINRRKRERQHSFSFSSKFGILIFLPTRICLPPL